MAKIPYIQQFIKSLFLSAKSDVQHTPELHPFTLKFINEHSHLEKGYLQFFSTTFTRQTQFSHIIAIIFYSLFSFLDVVFAPEYAKIFIFIRIAIVVPVFVLTLILSFRENFSKYLQLILSFSIFIAGLGIIAMIAIGGPEVNSVYYAGIILVFIFTYTFVGIKFKWATIVTWAIVLAYEIVSVYTGLDYKSFISNNFFFISTLLFSMVAGYSIEFYRRIEYYTFYLLEIEKNRVSNSNIELEEKVKERTYELNKAKDKAENANKLKSTFLAQMSHEIRTPINALINTATLLKYDFEKNATEDQLISFDVIDRAGNRIIRTIDLILNLSEIQAGTYEIDNTNINLYSDVLSLVIAENKRFAETKGLKLSLSAETLNTELTADEYTINQIFVQLIDNALKYTDEGEIKIIISRNENENLVVEIIDSGIGIDKKYLPNLFEPFSQEQMGYSRKYDGNGIGLTLVKKYCELNNATIEVESIQGSGSTFRVTFN